MQTFKPLSFILLLTCAWSLAARQTIRGTITVEQSATPLPGVSVLMEFQVWLDR